MLKINFNFLCGWIVDQIDAPHENEAAFVDRDDNHSIKTMVVCGPNLDLHKFSKKGVFILFY